MSVLLPVETMASASSAMGIRPEKEAEQYLGREGGRDGGREGGREGRG